MAFQIVRVCPICIFMVEGASLSLITVVFLRCLETLESIEFRGISQYEVPYLLFFERFIDAITDSSSHWQVTGTMVLRDCLPVSGLRHPVL